MNTIIIHKIVSNQDTAAVFLSGSLNVLATPALVGFMENAAYLIAQSLIEKENTTVGIAINIEHLKATKVGQTIEIRAALKARKDRLFEFEIEAYEENILIAKASHKRFLVNSRNFMKKNT